MSHSLVRVATSFLFLSSMAAQSPQLLRDINATARVPASDPADFLRAGALTYFSARTAGYGRELWRSDHLPAGTVRLTDIVPGVGDGNPQQLAAFGSRLLFVTGDPLAGQDLWISDGSAAGTQRLRTFAGPVWTAQHQLGAVGFVFTQNELWQTDGTALGTRRVHSFAYAVTWRPPTAVSNGVLFFARYEELWRTDGTAAGTRPLSDVGVFTELVVLGPHLYWAGTNALRRFDGNRIESFATGSTSIYSVAAAGGRVFWVDGLGLGCLDPAAPVPRRVPLPVTPRVLVGAGTHVFFLAFDAASGTELWWSDGTAAGTGMFDLEPGPSGADYQGLHAFGAGVLVAARRSSGAVELWRATGQRPALLGTFADGTRIGSMAVDSTGTQAMFGAGDMLRGNEPWVTDGTAAGTRLLVDLENTPGSTGSAYPSGFVTESGHTHFAADDGVVGVELWTTDGSTAGTRLVADLEPGVESGEGVPFGAHAGVVFLLANTRATGRQVWRTDGTAAGTRQLMQTPGVAYSASSTPLDARRALLMVAGIEGATLWVTDGHGAARLPVRPVGGAPLRRAGRVVYFTGVTATGEEELFVTDGTALGTKQVVDLNGADTPFVRVLAALGDQVLFMARDVAHYGLFVGGAEGARPLFAFTGLRAITAGDRVFVVGRDVNEVDALLVSDGTTAGTSVVAFLPSPADLVELDGRVLIGTRDGLWRSDGTRAGTVRLLDQVRLEGPPVSTGRHVYWSTTAGLFRSDGTTAGSGLIVPGNNWFTATLAVLADRIVFQRDDPRLGAEPWILDAGATVVTVGVGCGLGRVAPALTGTVPILGASARLRAEAPGSSGVAALVLALPASRPTFVEDRCAFYGDLRGPSAQLAVTLANGRFDVGFAVPAHAGLAGLELSAQALVLSPLGPELSNGVQWTLGR